MASWKKFNVPPAENFVSAASDGGDQVYLITFQANNTELYRYTISTDSWVALTGLSMWNNGYNVLQHYNGKLYNFKGYDGTNPSGIYIYDIISSTWAPRIDHPAGIMGEVNGSERIGNKLYVGTKSTNQTRQKIFEYNADLNTGRVVLDIASSDRLVSLCQHSGNNLYYFEQISLQVYKLNLDTLQRTLITTVPSTSSSYLYLASVLGFLVIFPRPTELSESPIYFDGTAWKSLNMPYGFLTGYAFENMSNGFLLASPGTSEGGGTTTVNNASFSSPGLTTSPFRYPTRWMEIANAT